MTYTFKSPDHHFYADDDGDEIEIAFVELIAEIEETREDEDSYRYSVIDIKWDKKEYTKDENNLINHSINDIEKRKKINAKIIKQYNSQEYYDNIIY